MILFLIFDWKVIFPPMGYVVTTIEILQSRLVMDDMIFYSILQISVLVSSKIV